MHLHVLTLGVGSPNVKSAVLSPTSPLVEKSSELRGTYLQASAFKRTMSFETVGIVYSVPNERIAGMSAISTPAVAEPSFAHSSLLAIMLFTLLLHVTVLPTPIRKPHSQ